MLIDVFRLTERTENKTTENLVKYLKSPSGGFNYQRAATYSKSAFSGCPVTESFFASCEKDKSSNALIHNGLVLRQIAPLAVGRNVKAFKLPRSKFALSADYHSNLGPQFFFTEDGVVKVAYIHARNNYRAGMKDFAGLGWAIKKRILDDDFFGLPSDVEFMDVDKSGKVHTVETYNLKRLEPYLAEDPNVTVARFVRCFKRICEQELAGELRKPKRKIIVPDATEIDQRDFGF